MDYEQAVIKTVTSRDRFLSVRDKGNMVWCSACKIIMTYQGRRGVDNHITSKKHKYNVNLYLEGPNIENIGNHEFVTDLCQALIAANIPIKALAKPKFRFFLEKYCRRKIPDESTVRRKYVVALKNNKKNTNAALLLAGCNQVTDETTNPDETNNELDSFNNSDTGNSYVDGSEFSDTRNEQTITQVSDVNTEMEVATDYPNSTPNTDEPLDIKPIAFVKIESHVVDNEPQLKIIQEDDAEVKLETQNNCNNSPCDCKQHYDIDVKDELQNNLLRANYANILISTQTDEMKGIENLANFVVNTPYGNKSETGDMAHTAGSTLINEQVDDSTHTGGKSNDCAMCGRSCTSLSSFMIHKRNQIVEQLYICDGCEPETHDADLESPNINKLPDDMEGLTNAASTCDNSEVKIPCENNSVTVGVNHSEHSTSADQKKNNPSHTDGITSYNCDLCGQSCRSLYSLVVHKRSHTGKPSHVSDIRGNTQPVSSSLAYKQIHTDNNYVCCVCDKVFKLKHLFLSHKRGHAFEKPYVCDVCDRGYLVLSGLVKHQRIHTTDKPHVSEISEGSAL